MCLGETDSDHVPTTQAGKMLLEEAGLGEKLIEVPLECTPELFRSVILSAFPKLEGGGGYEMLRCLPNSRELVLIGSRVSSTPKLLKRRVGTGRVYLRPLQVNLSLDAEEDEDVKVFASAA